MATNITQDTVPYIWTSANDDIIYTFTFKQKGTFAIADDGNGFCEIVLISSLDVTPVIGDYIFLDNPAYYGTFRIKEVTSSSQFVIDAAYIAPTIVYTTVRHLRIPTFTLYKGFKPLEGLSPLLPYTSVSDIKPPVLYTELGIPYISINVKAITSSIFTCSFNSEANSIDTDVFTPIRIQWDTETTTYLTAVQEYTLVLNSSINNSELLNKIAGGFYLTPIDKPLIYSQGVTLLTEFTISETYPRIRKYINGTLV